MDTAPATQFDLGTCFPSYSWHIFIIGLTFFWENSSVKGIQSHPYLDFHMEWSEGSVQRLNFIVFTMCGCFVHRSLPFVLATRMWCLTLGRRNRQVLSIFLPLAAFGFADLHVFFVYFFLQFFSLSMSFSFRFAWKILMRFESTPDGHRRDPYASTSWERARRIYPTMPMACLTLLKY